MSEHVIDELLELIWTQKEDGKDSLTDLLKITEEENPEEAIKAMVREGLIKITGDSINTVRNGYCGRR
ncbi:MAG: hypothetical protein Q7T53_00275 [Deltaproteobacteria bacterium]|nr:hypothetical protein [Deltaproteobacteria bacterium]